MNKCDVEVFSRVTGFFRPVQTWNEGKAEEFKDRKKYKMNMGTDGTESKDCRVSESVNG